MQPRDFILPAVLDVDRYRSGTVIERNLTYVCTARRQLIFGELLGGWIKLGNHISIGLIDPDVMVAVDLYSIWAAIFVGHGMLRHLAGLCIDSCDLI